jgi:putative oxidoreductase
MSLFNILFSGEKIEGFKANLGILILRVFTGLTMAFAHGIGKIPPSSNFIGMIDAKLGMPFPSYFAWGAALGEFLGGIFLALGLMTRPSAFFVFFTMGVAAFNAHGADPFGRKEKALLYFVISLFFMFTGPGKFSLDEIVRKKK